MAISGERRRRNGREQHKAESDHRYCLAFHDAFSFRNRSGCENRNHAAACDFWSLFGEQRWSGFTTQGGFMRGGEVLQDIALLLLQRRHHRHHACDKARALLTLSPKTALAPQHAWTERSLCRVVRRFDAVDLHEGPQRLASLQNLLAGPFGLGHPTLPPRFQ